ncbi:MAG: pentapeptide repeat-containing protein [Kineosporiaceae bacterium]
MSPARRLRDLDWVAEDDPALPDLDPPPALGPGTRLDAVDVVGARGTLDLCEATVLESRILDAALDDAVLRGARLSSTLVDGLASPAVAASNSTWLEVVARRVRVGALDLHGAHLSRVRLEGRIDYLLARGGEWTQVELGGATIGELDLSGATVRRVRLRGATIGKLVLHGADLDGLDLRGVRLESLEGVDRLRGAVLDDVLLAQLAPALADLLGIRVLPG